jgi:hypothetical protein
MRRTALLQHNCLFPVRARAGRCRFSLAALTAGALLLGSPAQAEGQIPGALERELLIKTSLLTLNDANVTGNYTVLHAKLAKPFQEQFSPDRLKQAFKTFADQKVDWGVVATKSPIEIGAAQIDQHGRLVLRGHFDTSPNRVTYALDFIPSEGEWKPVQINVKVKPPADN